MHFVRRGMALRLLQLVPAGLTRVFFSDSGSVAVEVAIKMSLQYWHGRGKPGKRRLLSVTAALWSKCS